MNKLSQFFFRGYFQFIFKNLCRYYYVLRCKYLIFVFYEGIKHYHEFVDTKKTKPRRIEWIKINIGKNHIIIIYSVHKIYTLIMIR